MHCPYHLGAQPQLLKRKILAWSFGELGAMRQRHVEIVLSFKCQIRTENVYYGRFEDGEKLN